MYLITGTDANGKRINVATHDYTVAMAAGGVIKGAVWAISTRPNGLQRRSLLKRIS